MGGLFPVMLEGLQLVFFSLRVHMAGVKKYFIYWKESEKNNKVGLNELSKMFSDITCIFELNFSLSFTKPVQYP